MRMRQEAIYQVKHQKTPVDLSKITGTYHWVWNGYTEVEADELTPGDRESEYLGGISLSLKAPPKAKLEDVCGSFNYGSLRAKFEGLEPLMGKFAKTQPGTWNVCHAEWEQSGGGEDMPEDGQEVWVSEVLDDNGHPFVGMYINCGYMGCVEVCWDMLAKRQAEGYELGKKGMAWIGLTTAEKARLGLLKRNGAEDGNEDGEQASSGEGEIEEEDTKPTLEEHTKRALKEEDVVAKPALKKRKATISNGSQVPAAVKVKRE